MDGQNCDTLLTDRPLTTSPKYHGETTFLIKLQFYPVGLSKNPQFFSHEISAGLFSENALSAGNSTDCETLSRRRVIDSEEQRA